MEAKKYPARLHSKRVAEIFRNKSGVDHAAFFVSGEDNVLYEYSDQTKPFRQNRYFYYLSGCDIPGSHVLYDTGADTLTLFLPNIDVDDVLWSGMPLSKDEALEAFDVDFVEYASEIQSLLNRYKDVGIYVTDINNRNQGFHGSLISGDLNFMFALDESRMIKDAFEIDLMRKAAAITDNCHLAVMSATPIEKKETHIHAEFIYHAIRQGSKHQLYDPICCSGTNCSTLHYVKNDDDIGNTKRSVLIDAGAEWKCYASDVTRCFPVNGDWTKEHLQVYNIVLKMQRETMALIKPGASWDLIHLHAHKVLIQEFLSIGIFVGEPLEIFESGISAAFFPHGLGHLLGMDTHDVGGNANYEDPDPKLRYLRLRRLLQEGMVLTDEPGVYFSPFLLKDVLEDPAKSKFIDREILENYWDVGGVRIEDDLLITKGGYENFTKITSDPFEISAIIKKSFQNKTFHNIV